MLVDFVSLLFGVWLFVVLCWFVCWVVGFWVYVGVCVWVWVVDACGVWVL